MEDRAIKILLIEDDPEDVLFIRTFLEDPRGEHFPMETAGRLAEGLAALEKGSFDIVLADLMLPDSRGLETFLRLKASRPDAAFIVLTGLQDESLAIRAVGQGAQDYLVKGAMDAQLLKRSIRYAVERNRLVSHLQRIIEKSADAMVVVDAGGIVRYENPAAEALFGVPASETVGKPFLRDVSANSVAELEIPGAEGASRQAEMRVTEIEWNQAPAYLASIRDITELKRLEQLRAEVKERRKIDRLKDQFLHSVSHELRSPLTIIKAAVGNMRDGLVGELTAAQRELVGMADRNIVRLTKIINNLLDLSRLESGKAAINRRRMDVPPVLKDMLACFQLTPEGNRVGLELSLEADVPPVLADPDMFVQVVSNLLDNATRYATGKVTLRAAKYAAPVPVGARGARAGAPEDEPLEGALITVADDGPGIPSEKLGELFNKFVQINRPVGGSGYKGTGLGLAICKEIVDLHHGKIWVESAAGKGASFHVVFPRA